MEIDLWISMEIRTDRSKKAQKVVIFSRKIENKFHSASLFFNKTKFSYTSFQKVTWRLFENTIIQ